MVGIENSVSKLPRGWVFLEEKRSKLERPRERKLSCLPWYWEDPELRANRRLGYLAFMLAKTEGRRRRGMTEDEMVGWHH